jgi:hypothetical protein
LRGGFEAHEFGSFFPDRSVVNFLFANDSGAFFKPDVRRLAGTEVISRPCGRRTTQRENPA